MQESFITKCFTAFALVAIAIGSVPVATAQEDAELNAEIETETGEDLTLEDLSDVQALDTPDTPTPPTKIEELGNIAGVVGQPINFKLSLDQKATETTTVKLSDGGAGGTFFGGTHEGVCNVDNGPITQVTIRTNSQSKSVCYQNDAEGEYDIFTEVTTGDNTILIAQTATVKAVVSMGEDDQGGENESEDTNQPDTNPTWEIKPIFECYLPNEDGVTATGYFGYTNSNTETVTIDFGDFNKVQDGPDRGQPTEFLPGRTPFVNDTGVFRPENAAFSVEFDLATEAIEWTLGNPAEGKSRTATAGSLGAVCPEPTPIDTKKPQIDQKDGANRCESGQGFSNVSYKLKDNVAIDYVLINGEKKDLKDDKFSDLNGVRAGRDGAVEGMNTIQLFDTAGNMTEIIVTLCAGRDKESSAPTATIKPEEKFTTTCELGYSMISYKLRDKGGEIDRVEINGVVKDLSDNEWSDVNFIKPGVFGAVAGQNTMVVYDVDGNNATYTFTLCPASEPTPVLQCPADHTVETIATLSVDSRNPAGATTDIDLLSTEDYLITVSGTFTWGPGTGKESDRLGGNSTSKDNVSDAEYSSFNGFGSSQPSSPAFWDPTGQTKKAAGKETHDLYIDGVDVEWGAYNAAHTYQTLVSGTDSPMNFAIFEEKNKWYRDNRGTLTVTVAGCVAPDTTPNVCSLEGAIVRSTDNAVDSDGNPVATERRTLTALDTIASYQNVTGGEATFNPSDFFSLGINGELDYEFTGQKAVDTAGDDIAIYEVTGSNRDTKEAVEVLLSDDGVNFASAGTITGDGSVDIAVAGLTEVTHVRLVDQTTVGGDGYDVDAIVILDSSCTPYVATGSGNGGSTGGTGGGATGNQGSLNPDENDSSNPLATRVNRSNNGGAGGALVVADIESGDEVAGTVAGISTTAAPTPLVAGEQVTVVPSGGANTGAGGTATGTNAAGALAILALLTFALRFVRMQSHGQG